MNLEDRVKMLEGMDCRHRETINALNEELTLVRKAKADNRAAFHMQAKDALQAIQQKDARIAELESEITVLNRKLRKALKQNKKQPQTPVSLHSTIADYLL